MQLNQHSDLTFLLDINSTQELRQRTLLNQYSFIESFQQKSKLKTKEGESQVSSHGEGQLSLASNKGVTELLLGSHNAECPPAAKQSFHRLSFSETLSRVGQQPA